MEKRVGDKTKVWRTTGCGHFLKGPSGTTGSSSPRTRTYWIQIREFKKHADPAAPVPDADPQHCYKVFFFLGKFSIPGSESGSIDLTNSRSQFPIRNTALRLPTYKNGFVLPQLVQHYAGTLHPVGELHFTQASTRGTQTNWVISIVLTRMTHYGSAV